MGELTKDTVKVYIWLEDLQRLFHGGHDTLTGHASLAVKDALGTERYLSWWPKGDFVPQPFRGMPQDTWPVEKQEPPRYGTRNAGDQFHKTDKFLMDPRSKEEKKQRDPETNRLKLDQGSAHVKFVFREALDTSLMIRFIDELRQGTLVCFGSSAPHENPRRITKDPDRDKRTIDQIRGAGKNVYHVIYQSCSTTVSQALFVGDQARFKLLAIEGWTRPLWLPSDVARRCQELYMAVRAKRSQPGMPMGMDADITRGREKVPPPQAKL